MSNPNGRERQVFDPESIRNALELDLAEGLRALADAIDAHDIDGALSSVTGNGLTHWRDTRMRLRDDRHRRSSLPVDQTYRR